MKDGFSILRRELFKMLKNEESEARDGDGVLVLIVAVGGCLQLAVDWRETSGD